MTRLIGPIVALLLLMVLAASGADNTSVYAQGSLSPPTDVTAADGDNPREAKLTWEPVIDADYYRIGWVDYADLQAATDAGLEWLEAFVFVDVSNRGQTSYTVTGHHHLVAWSPALIMHSSWVPPSHASGWPNGRSGPPSHCGVTRRRPRASLRSQATQPSL